jgi:hypothetical protein
MTDYRAHLRQRLRESGVPTSLQEGLLEYFAARRPTGGFLRACLENNYTEACMRADDVNRFYLFDVATFLVSYVPSPAWGSEAAVDAWLADPTPVPEVYE